MARIYPLYSSSKGNATFLGNSKSGVLIDAGVTYKKLCEGMIANNLDVSAIKAVFITHDHSDHIKGLKILTKQLGIPVYSQGGTLMKLLEGEMINAKSSFYSITDNVVIDDMEISMFKTPHDTEQSCGYIINTNDGKKAAVCTDLGHITTEVEDNLYGCNLVLLESNYDEEMLTNGPYPYYLKNRIRSSNGHLSNKDSALHIEKLIKTGTTRIVLGHLSQENNTPQIAYKTALNHLNDFKLNEDYLLSVAPVNTTGMMVNY